MNPNNLGAAKQTQVVNLDSIWREYQHRLKGFLLKNLDNPSDVDDVLQEIMLKTHTKLHTLNDPNKIKPWLFQIANHTIIDFYRQSKKHHSSNNEGSSNESSSDEEPHLLAEDDEQLIDKLTDCIEPFIQSLSSEDATLLKAIEINGISQKDYAKKNNIKYSTLKSRVKKSRQALLHKFQQCCEFSYSSQGQVLDYHKRDKQCGDC
ncbi:sigma-70 family RNA polymerase sigma factor [Vibrio mexicanus]|uniref:sigma-70 family RNA polymerase sigma factor n=1 Tax=Vibrio mexicanus TaxID=1004326 RepID=UPI00063C58C8|nr:sigma-70 family RNA polymerase sigma factor [Vibrio mexicanus]